jgi:hypothetical protein
VKKPPFKQLSGSSFELLNCVVGFRRQVLKFNGMALNPEVFAIGLVTEIREIPANRPVGSLAGPDKFNGVVKSVNKLIKILLVKKKFMFLVKELALVIKSALAFSNGQISFIFDSCFNIKKVCTFTGPYSPREDFTSFFTFVFRVFHCYLAFGFSFFDNE